MATKDRQRALARAKLERQMAKRAEDARKRRRLLAGAAAIVALVLLVAGGAWLVIAFNDDDAKPSDQASNAACEYFDERTRDTSVTKNVGKPPVENVPTTGAPRAVLSTNMGDLNINLDRAAAPCTVNSWTHLASKSFYDNTTCHRMLDSLVQCGDPFADGKDTGTKTEPDKDGQGGPTYRYGDENLPKNVHPTPYPKGTVAMADTGVEDSVSSQFFILFTDGQLPPDYTVVGKVQDGDEVLGKIAGIGHDGAFEPTPENPQAPGGGHPKQPITITSLRVI